MLISEINNFLYKSVCGYLNFIKYATPSIVFPLSLILNCYIELAEVPKLWKISFVILVHKKVNNHNAFNYRPISVTSGFSRAFAHQYLKKTFITFLIIIYYLINSLVLSLTARQTFNY